MKYEIKGGDLPVVICQLDAGETIVTESGSMSWMDSNVEMDTKGGGVGKVFGRKFAGESLFRNHSSEVRESYTAPELFCDLVFNFRIFLI